MATEVGSLVIPIEANTAALDKAAQTIASFGKKFDTTVKNLVKSIDSFGKSIDTISKRMKGMSTASVASATKTEQALAKQAAATIHLKAQTVSLVAAFKATGEARQFPELISAVNSRIAFLEKMMRSGKVEVVEFAKKSAELEVALKRLADATRQVGSAEKKVAVDTKEVAAKVQQVTQSTNPAVAALRSYRKAVDDVSTSSSKAAKKTFDLKEQMINLSKSVSVALGPLNGVAARITSITSLANRNTIAIAAMIGGVIALGAVFTKSVKIGIEFEKEMNIIKNQLQSTGRGVTTTANQMREFAQALGEATLESASTVRRALIIIGAESSLTFDQLQKATERAADLAATGLGSIDIAARRMLRAFSDPASGLEGFKRAGVTFTIQQKRIIEKLLESGQKAKAFDIILTKLNKKVGGNAVASAKGLAGALDTLNENMKLFFEVQSSEGGVLQGIADSINNINDQLQEYNDNTKLAIASGNAFAIGATTFIDALGFLIENLGKVISLLAGFAAFKIIGILGRFGKGVFTFAASWRAASGAIGKVLELLVFFGRFAGPIAALAGVVWLVAEAFLGADDSAKKFKKTLADLDKIKIKIDAGQVIGAIEDELIKEQTARVAEMRIEEKRLKKEIDATSAALAFLAKHQEAVNEFKKKGFEATRDLREALAFEEQVLTRLAKIKVGEQIEQKDLTQLVTQLEHLQTLIDKLAKTTDFAGVVDSDDAGINTALLRQNTLSIAQDDIIKDINKEWKETTNLIDRVAGFLKTNNELVFVQAERMADATTKAKEFLQSIVDASKARGEDVGLTQIAADQVQATNQLIESARKAGVAFVSLISNADDAEVAVAKIFAAFERQDDIQSAAKSFRDFENSTMLAVEAELRLADATLMGGAAVREAIILNQILSGEYKHRGDEIEDLRSKLETLAQAQDASTTAIRNANIARDQMEQIATLKTQLEFLGETELRQNQINATIEKTIELRRRGVDLSSETARLELKNVLIIEKLAVEYQLVLDRQADLKSAIDGIGDAFGSAIEDAIVDFDNLGDVIASLEKDILRLITQVLITDPLKRGISTGLAGFTDPTGPKGDNVSSGAGIEDLTAGFFDKLFGTRIDPNEGIENQGDIINSTSDAMLGLVSSADEAASAQRGFGGINQTVGTIMSAILGTNAVTAGGSLQIVGLTTQTLTVSMIELIGATKLASAALAAMAAQGAGSGGADIASKLLGVGLGSLGVGSPATPLANVASVTPGLMGSFDQGADFTIGGKGGVDRNLIQFMGSRGEHVSVSPTGEGRKSTVKQTLVFNVSGDTSETTMNQIAVIVGRHTQRALGKELA